MIEAKDIIKVDYDSAFIYKNSQPVIANSPDVVALIVSVRMAPGYTLTVIPPTQMDNGIDIVFVAKRNGQNPGNTSDSTNQQ